MLIFYGLVGLTQVAGMAAFLFTALSEGTSANKRALLLAGSAGFAMFAIFLFILEELYFCRKTLKNRKFVFWECGET